MLRRMKEMKRLGLLLMGLCWVWTAWGQETYPFVQRDTTTLMLDLYRPAEPANGYTVVHIYGGGFINGSRTKQWDADYCRRLAEMGYTAVAMDYRLGLRSTYTDGKSKLQALKDAFYMAAADCSAAVRYLVEHGKELGIAADKIILEGSSAGAITALMTDFGRCNGLAFAAELPEGWKPAGVVAYSGAIYSETGSLKWAQAPAPTLLFHGEVDKIVPYKQIVLGRKGLYGSSAITKKMEKYEYPYCVYRLKNLGHEVSVAGPMTTGELEFFVQQYVKDGRRLYEDVTMRDASVGPSKWTDMRLRDLYKKPKSTDNRSDK